MKIFVNFVKIKFKKELNPTTKMRLPQRSIPGILISCICFMSSFAQAPLKIDGVSFVSSRDSITYQHVKPVLDVNANWVALSPFGFLFSLDNPQLNFNHARQWFGERTDGIRQMTGEFKRHGVKVMLKPQLWIRHGEFTGHIKMLTEADWVTFDKNYADFILTYARLAQEEKIEMFAIGTELASYVAARPNSWKKLIAEVRKVYKGKITYAENWDTYDKFPHWALLDFIGIDAYFPLSEEKTPTVAHLLEKWQPVKTQIKHLSLQTQKPVLFTEYGYRSIDYTTLRPWDSSRELNTLNFEAQKNALEAIHTAFWNEDWFVGGFLWKWFHKHEQSGGTSDSQYTVQNKPAQVLMGKLYSRL